MTQHHVVITGATGYIGRAVAEVLRDRGHAVRGVVRAGSASKLPSGIEPILGDALDANSYAAQLAPADTLVQLVGTPHPGPAKTAEFRRVDLPSGLAAVEAARIARVRHLVYVSVANPAPVMHAYIDVRLQVEARIREAVKSSELTATILQPWYVLGPGHRWPYALFPLYAIASLIPSMRDGARRLGLVTRRTMINALVAAVERRPNDDRVRVWDVPAIRVNGS